VLEIAITGLTVEEQIEVVKGLSKYLVNQGVVREGVSDFITTIVRYTMLTYFRSWTT
jgi:phosphatidate cytidylyltransferase